MTICDRTVIASCVNTIYSVAARGCGDDDGSLLRRRTHRVLTTSGKKNMSGVDGKNFAAVTFT